MSGNRRMPSDETLDRIRAQIDQMFSQSTERSYRSEADEDRGEFVIEVDDAAEREKAGTVVDEYDVSYETRDGEIRVFVTE
ncbi:hypothetical protein ACFQE1_13995 [Halobium palmae]|uniref:Amphi-Trp domain-containing protein n=1 Tax=Halobium palmae TaxID=1776492 RepID=A0ABD5S1J8_9EURY